MQRLISWIGFSVGFTLILVIIGISVWRFASPRFVDRTVDEALPFALPLPILATPTSQFPTEDEIGVIMPPTATLTTTEVITVTPVVTTTEGATSTSTVTATAEITATDGVTTTAIVTETTVTTIATNIATILGQGSFVDGDAIHKGSGVATLYHTPEGAYLLRFDDFVTTNGPDVHVLLSPNATPASHDTLGEYLDLGEIKGNIGDQNYPLPADFDPTLYKSVVIHCLAFNVIFATATLE